MSKQGDVELIAEFCHEANKAICESFGDFSQSSWDNAAQWQKDAALAGVAFKLENQASTSEQLHQNWMKQKLDDGWLYGDEKNADKKTHPCLVPYENLPAHQRAKDAIFNVIVENTQKILSALHAEKKHVAR